MSHAEFAEAQRAWFGKLVEGGWAIPHWPAEWPGGGRSLAEQKVFYEELARADCPRLLLSFVSTYHAAATIMECGSEAQKARYLPAILEGEFWCQGFSEPGAGSDLASLKCKAERKGRRLCRQRPEDLVDHGAICRQVHAAGAHLERRPQAGRNHVPDHGHEGQGRHRPADQPDPGRPGILRDLPRRCRSAGVRPDRRGRRRLGGDLGDAFGRARADADGADLPHARRAAPRSPI